MAVFGWSIAGWDWVTLIGGALQVGGVLLLVTDVVKTFRRVEDYRRRPQVVELGHAIDASVVFPVAVIGGQQPTTEERLERLESGLREVREQLQEETMRLRAEARQAADEAAERTVRHGDRRFVAIELALLGDTPSDKRRRLLSIGLIVFGVGLATIGSIGPGPA